MNQCLLHWPCSGVEPCLTSGVCVCHVVWHLFCAAAGGASILDNPIATGRMMRLDAADAVQQRVQALQLQGQQQAAAKLPTS